MPIFCPSFDHRNAVNPLRLSKPPNIPTHFRILLRNIDMDAPEPADTPFAAFQAHTSRIGRVSEAIIPKLPYKQWLTCTFKIYQSYLDKSTPYIPQRWGGTAALFVIFCLRIIFSQGWYIGEQTPSCHVDRPTLTTNAVAYSLGIYLLNLFLAFISPKFDPSLEQDEGMEDGTSGALPTKEEEFRPFVRRLPEFKFWYSSTKAVFIAFVCTWIRAFDLPVFWPVLVVYWLILFALTSKFMSHFLSHIWIEY